MLAVEGEPVVLLSSLGILSGPFISRAVEITCDAILSGQLLFIDVNSHLFPMLREMHVSHGVPGPTQRIFRFRHGRQAVFFLG